MAAVRDRPVRRPVLRAVALLGLVVGGALFVVLSALVWHTQSAVALDRTLVRVIAAGPGGGLLAAGGSPPPRPDSVVPLGSVEIVVVLALGLAIVALAWGDGAGGVLGLAAPGLTGALTEYVLKPLITPPSLGSGRAFPSGHAGGVTAIALVAVALVYRRWGWMAALAVAPLAVLPIVLVGHALVRLDYHFPTDVLGGVLLASLVVLGLQALLALTGRPTVRSGPATTSPPSADPSVLA
ncbi:MAG: phosphatase PAP2 family protein [Acidimicrobiales bacterium]